jgi:hypothetical protein
MEEALELKAVLNELVKLSKYADAVGQKVPGRGRGSERFNGFVLVESAHCEC